MEELSKYNLAFGLFKSIAIFDQSNTIVLAGEQIKRLFNDAGMDLFQMITDDQPNSEGSRLLEVLQQIRLGKFEMQTHTFSNLDKEFILFPANATSFDNIVLSSKEEIEQITKIEHDLKERVKETECLYNISRELESLQDLDVVLNNCVDIIRNGFQYPEQTHVQIEFEGDAFGSGDLYEKKADQCLMEYILRNNRKRGFIAVCDEKEEPFLDEEKALLKELARKLSHAIETRDKRTDLEKRKKVLLEKNKTLMRLTEECREGREKLQAFFTAITDKIVVIDPDFNIILSNNKEVGEKGKCYKQLFNSDTICVDCPAKQTFNNGTEGVLEKHDSSTTVLLNTYPIFAKDQKTVDRVLEVCRDITKEKQMEAQLIQSHKLASLGKLVTGVAHEINNPNTFILGNMKIIREAFSDIIPVLDAYYTEHEELKIARLPYQIFKENINILVEDMVNGSVRMKKIVEDLRYFAKKDADVLDEEVYINGLIENTVRLVKKQIGKNTNLNLNLEALIPVFIGNITKLEQVVINMIVNASQAIGMAKGEISIQTVYNKAEEKVSIVISDNGKGMDEKTQRNIFDPFFTTKRNEGGTGLGLSISYGIIKEHGGLISVDSELNKGTCFTISLPVKTKEE